MGGGAAFLFKYPTPEEFPEKLHFSPNLTFLTIQAKMLSNLGPLQLIVDHVKWQNKWKFKKVKDMREGQNFNKKGKGGRGGVVKMQTVPKAFE